MKITFLPSERCEIQRIHCPECGERVRNVGLDVNECKTTGLRIRCKRCKGYFLVNAESEAKVN